MKIFMLKSILIVMIMFISVLAGIQLANDGIHKMKGYSDSENNNTFSFIDQNNQQGDSNLESDSSSHDLKVKKEKLEKLNAFNIFSSVGKTMSDGISKTSEKILNSIAN
jgi:hypothetical protein